MLLDAKDEGNKNHQTHKEMSGCLIRQEGIHAATIGTVRIMEWLN